MNEPVNLARDTAAYEAGELDEDQVLDLFQALVGTGLAWQLQGSYGRTAQAMIDAGLIALPEVELDPEPWLFMRVYDLTGAPTMESAPELGR